MTASCSWSARMRRSRRRSNGSRLSTSRLRSRSWALHFRHSTPSCPCWHRSTGNSARPTNAGFSSTVAGPTRPRSTRSRSTSGAAEILGLGVGDVLEYDGLTPEEFERCWQTDDAPSECEELIARTDGPFPIKLDVVGLVRSTEDITGAATDFAIVTATPAFYEHYHGVIGEAADLVSVRLRDGTTPEQFAEEVDAILPDGAEAVHEFNSGESVYDATNTLAVGLLVFGLVVLIAASVAVGQAVLRQLQAAGNEHATLRALGMGRGPRAIAVALPVLPVALLGSMLGVFGAWFASRWFPTGVAGRGEPDPGVDFDATVLLGGALVFALAFAGLTLGGAWWRTRPRGGARERVSRPFLRSVRALQPPALGIGAGLALDAGRGPRAVPVRSAFVACIAATAGVVAVLAFAAGLHRLQSTPELFGTPYDAMGFTDPEPLLEDPEVEAVAAVKFRAPLRVNGRPVPGFSYDALRGDLGPTVVTGRAPETDAEIALGADTMKLAGVEIGDSVQVAGSGPAREMLVVGTSVFPVIDNSNELADGVVVMPETIVALDASDQEMFDSYVIRVEDGADTDRVVERLARNESGLDGGITRSTPPGEVRNLDEVDAYPTALAVVLAVLGIAGLAHALALAARRRAPDLALLRALGFRRRDVGRAIAWQSLTIATVGVVVGVPLGLLIGRVSWRFTADNVGVRVEHVLPVLALVAAVPVVVLVAMAAAWLPARRATRLHPTEILRNE